MKIKLDKKGREFAAKKDIKALFINPDLDSKEACCTIGTVDFDVSTKAIGKLESYHKYEDENIEIYVNPNIYAFIKNDEEIEISAFGLGSFKKFYIKNEINTIER